MSLYIINCFIETRPTDCHFTPWVAWLLDHSVQSKYNLQMWSQ
jgi:hypothetical protein